ncbi:MAG TPA: hypothetical protein VH592_25205 [Gemmataceae bacterium]|jgi:hypothetical protein
MRHDRQLAQEVDELPLLLCAGCHLDERYGMGKSLDLSIPLLTLVSQ